MFNKKSVEWKRVCFAITLLHSCINERTTYAHCGWNQDYIFGEADYDLCMLHLNSIMSSQDFSMSTLQYLIAECTYGGKMEDEWDMRTLTTFLELICSHLKDDAHAIFDPAEVYHTKRMEDHETLMDYLKELPTEASHNMMRVNGPNHWNKNQARGLDFLKKLRLTQGLDLKSDDSDDEGGGDDAIKEKITKILKITPEEFEFLEDVDGIMMLVLDQELQKYNK